MQLSAASLDVIFHPVHVKLSLLHLLSQLLHLLTQHLMLECD